METFSTLVISMAYLAPPIGKAGEPLFSFVTFQRPTRHSLKIDFRRGGRHVLGLVQTNISGSDGQRDLCRSGSVSRDTLP